MRSLQVLTASSPPAIIVQRVRHALFFLIGLIGSLTLGTVLGILGVFFIATPIAMLTPVLNNAAPLFMIPLAGVAAATIWTVQYFSGFAYMDCISRLGFKNRKEVLTPIFLSSLLFWVGAGATVATTGGVNFGTFAILIGFGLNLYGQRQRMMMLRRGLPYVDKEPIIKIESQGNLYDHLSELKTAETIEHLEQLCKQCLVTIKPALAASSDCTSTLINELMKRKLRSEADELSLLQLTLSEKETV